MWTAAVVSHRHRLQLRPNSNPNKRHEVLTLRIQCFCPRGMSLSLRIIEDHFTSQLSLDHKVLKNWRRLRTLQTVCYVWPCEVHKFGRVKNGLLTDYLLIVSKSLFAVTQCCCPWGKSLSSRILEDQFSDLQILILVIEPKSLITTLTEYSLVTFFRYF